MTDLDPAAVMAERAPYDPTLLDLNGSRADVAWLRAVGVTNIPERLTALLDEYDRLAEALVAAQEDVARLSAYSAAAFDQRDAAQDALAASEVKVARVEQERDNFWEGVRSFMRQADRIIDLLRGKPDDLMIRVDRIRDAIQGTSQPFADQPEQTS